MKMDDKMKAYGLGVISAILLILSFIGVISLINGFNKDDETQSYSELYATVYSVGNGEIVVDPIDEEIDGNITIKTDEKFKKGDFVLIDGEEIKVIAKADEFETTQVAQSLTTSKTTTERVIPTTSSTVTTKGKTTTTKNGVTTTKKTTKKTTVSTTKKTTTAKKDKDTAVLDYVESVNNDANKVSGSDATFGQKVKTNFIKIVDFIFYDTEINGVKWSELTASAKAKVVYYTLKIDNKIDEKFPNYKENISNKYNDLKAKLIAKYLDITNTICSNSEHDEYHCGIVKQDFQLLKDSVGITWDVVVNAFKYGYDKSTAYLKTWYETFSGK